MTPTTLVFGKETEGWMRLSEALDDGLGQPFEQPDVVAAALLSLPPDRRAAIAAELLDVETLAPHPDEQHEFRTTCLRCGGRGTLHISLIGPDEVVTIAALRSPQ